MSDGGAPAAPSSGRATPATPAGADDDEDASFSVDEETLRRARETTLSALSDSVRQVLAVGGSAPAAEAGTWSAPQARVPVAIMRHGADQAARTVSPFGFLVAHADPYDAFADYLSAGAPTIEGVKEQARFLDDEKVRSGAKGGGGGGGKGVRQRRIPVDHL